MWPDKDSRNNVHSISGARYPWNLRNAKEILSTLIWRQHNFAHDWSRWTFARHLLVFEFDHTESNRSALSPAEPHLNICPQSDPKCIINDGSMSIFGVLTLNGLIVKGYSTDLQMRWHLEKSLSWLTGKLIFLITWSEGWGRLKSTSPRALSGGSSR